MEKVKGRELFGLRKRELERQVRAIFKTPLQKRGNDQFSICTVKKRREGLNFSKRGSD